MLILIVLLVVLVLVLCFLSIRIALFGAATKDQLRPGPNTWQLLRNISKIGKKPHVAFRDLARIYGPIMSTRLGGHLVVIASSSSLAKNILITQDRIFSGRYLPSVYYKVPRALESSLTVSKECDETWKFLRRIGHNFIYSSKSVESKAGIRENKVSEMVKYLRSKIGQSVKLDDVVNATVTNIMSNIFISRNLFDVRGEDENDEKVRKLVHEIVDMFSSLGLCDLFPVLEKVDFWTKWKAMEIYRNIMCIWGDVTKERRARRDHNYISSSAPDFLDVLPENGLSDDQICIILMELLMAASDSTSITLVWSMVELIRHPDVLHRVREEVAKAFDGDTLINETILTESQYFQSCIKEILRFRNPGPFLIPHRAIETCTVDKYVVPKNCTVLVNAWAIGLDPNRWKDATSFKPDRFVGSKFDFRGNFFEFLPFGAGRRMCPGWWNMAFKNIQLVVASLVHYFDWSLPNGVDPNEIDTSEKFVTTLKKEKPLFLIPRLRE